MFVWGSLWAAAKVDGWGIYAVFREAVFMVEVLVQVPVSFGFCSRAREKGVCCFGALLVALKM